MTNVNMMNTPVYSFPNLLYHNLKHNVYNIYKNCDNKVFHWFSPASKQTLFKPKGNCQCISKHGNILLPARWVIMLDDIFTVSIPTYHTCLGHSVD